MRNVALIVAIVLGIAAAIGVHRYMVNQTRQFQQEHKLVAVATATRSIDAGEKLDADMVSFDQLRQPADSLTGTEIMPGDLDFYLGLEFVRAVDRSKPILNSYFLRREQHGGSKALAEGTTAVSIGVSATEGVAGLIRPGDHVDIYATTSAQAGAATSLVLSGVAVLAVDSRLSDVPTGLPGYGEPQRGYATLTLMVTPEEAQLLVYLDSSARLTCALLPRTALGETRTPPAPIGQDNWQKLAEEANAKRRERLEAQLKGR